MRRYLLIGLALYGVYLLFTFPAQIALHWFAPPTVKAWGVKGSVWNGSARALAVGPAVLGETDWELSKAWLLVGNLSADVRTRVGQSRLNTHLSRFVLGARLELQTLQGIVMIEDLPAAWLAGLRNVGVTDLDGRLGLSFQELALVDGWPSDAQGSVDLVELDVTTPLGAERLGSFEVLFDGADDETLRGRLGDTGGPITMEGQVEFLPERAYRYRVIARAKPGAPATIVQALDSTGQAAPGGGALFEDSGQLP